MSVGWSPDYKTPPPTYGELLRLSHMQSKSDQMMNDQIHAMFERIRWFEWLLAEARWWAEGWRESLESKEEVGPFPWEE